MHLLLEAGVLGLQSLRLSPLLVFLRLDLHAPPRAFILTAMFSNGYEHITDHTDEFGKMVRTFRSSSALRAASASLAPPASCSGRCPARR